ncbi:MAG: DNA mismatch repair endonuclease MutL [Bdellovibrionales bacterium]|nr:DNA mismatch repair endonuclease MutL [Bdellovibrionales bacterium]
MRQIYSLPQDTINQIAAGEVVERPSQIVKELVENAIDAEAAHIEVEFDEGGRFLKVRDDGYGISREQMALALARHATSKIKNFDDLWSLNTHGFRGEALASIAAVSDLTLISQTKDSPAFKLRSCFGALQDIQPTGGARGTLVIVQSLFENTPARFKFLKPPAAENTAIKQTLKALALSHFHLSFRVLSRGRLIFYWPAQKDIVARSQQVLGLEDLYFAEGRQGAYSLKAALAAPHNTLKIRRSSWLFVSHRWVECRVMQSALMAAYRGLLMHGEYPIAVVHINGPGDEIDVNVHPAKSQVRFKDSSLIFKLVESSVRSVLEKAPWTRKISSHSSSKEQNLQFRDSGFEKTHFRKAREGISSKTLSSLAWEESPDISERSLPEEKSTEHLGGKAVSQKPDDSESMEISTHFSEKEFKEERPWSSLQVLAQAHLTYIVCQSDKAVIFIDQHAAHERFLYEMLFHSFKKGEAEIQNHLVPVSLNLEEDEMEALKSLQENLERIGVKVEQLGPVTAGVTASPALLKDQALKEGILFLTRKFTETRDHFAFEKVVSDLFATMSCHSAIRAGQSLTERQMTELLKQMDQFPLSSFCPHGRPVFVEYPISRLERDFCRQV